MSPISGRHPLLKYNLFVMIRNGCRHGEGRAGGIGGKFLDPQAERLKDSLLPLSNFVEILQRNGLTGRPDVINLTAHVAHYVLMRLNAGSPPRKGGLWLLSKKILDSLAGRGLNLAHAL
jgi:hypothetical protein